MLFRKKIFCFCFVLKTILWLSDCEKKISVFLSEEYLEEKKQPPSPPPPHTHTEIKWSVPKQVSRDVAHMVSCYFLVYFHCNKQYKKANKNRLASPVSVFFAVIFTDTTETLVKSPAG